MSTYAGRAAGRRVAWRRRSIWPPSQITIALAEAPVVSIVADLTISSGTINVTVGETVVVCLSARQAGSARTINPPTTTLPLGAFTKVDDFSQIDTETTAYCMGSMYYAVATGTGPGIVTQTLGGNAANRTLAILKLTSVSALGIKNKTVQEVAGPLTCVLSAVPNPLAAGIAFVTRRVIDTTVTDPVGFTQHVDAGTGVNLQMMIHSKIGNAPQSVTYSGLSGNEAQGLIYATFLD